jgi:hypothetical protein
MEGEFSYELSSLSVGRSIVHVNSLRVREQKDSLVMGKDSITAPNQQKDCNVTICG